VCWCCKAGGALGSYQAGAFRRSVIMASIRNGSRAFPSARSTPRSSPEIRQRHASPAQGILGHGVVGPVVPWRRSQPGDQARSLFNETSAALIATFGVPGFFSPRLPPAPLWPAGSPQSQSYYDTSAAAKTLERLVDFDRINA
jgi:NTE family protein